MDTPTEIEFDCADGVALVAMERALRDRRLAYRLDAGGQWGRVLRVRIPDSPAQYDMVQKSLLAGLSAADATDEDDPWLMDAELRWNQLVTWKSVWRGSDEEVHRISKLLFEDPSRVIFYVSDDGEAIARVPSWDEARAVARLQEEFGC